MILSVLFLAAAISAKAFAADAFAADAEAGIRIQAGLTLKGMEALAERPYYTFRLDAVGDAPLPAKTEVVMKQAGTIDFGTITYHEPGDYCYRLYQQTDSVSDRMPPVSAGTLTLDRRIYELTVQVTSDEKGKLYAALSSSEEGAGKKSEPEFLNTYKPAEAAAPLQPSGPAAAGPVRTGDTTPIAGTLLTMAGAGTIIFAFPLNRRRRRA